MTRTSNDLVIDDALHSVSQSQNDQLRSSSHQQQHPGHQQHPDQEQPSGHQQQPDQQQPDQQHPDRGKPDDLLQRAHGAYRKVVSDPKTHGPEVAELVTLARRTRAWEPLILFLRAHAWAQRSQFALADAKANLDEAAKLARRHHLSERLGEVLVTRAAVHTELGKMHAAQRDLTTAGGLNTVQGKVEMALQQAVLNHNLGQLTPAAKLYQEILDAPGAATDIRAKSANNLAIIESQLGRLDLAQQHAAMAAQLAIEVGPALEALFATTRGWITIQTGRLTESIEIFDDAADRYSKAGIPLGEHYLEYADALTELRLLPEAFAISRRAVDEFQRNGVDLMAAEGRYRVAVLALLTGNLQAAADTATSAYIEFTRQRRAAWAARTSIVMVETELKRGNPTPHTLTRARQAARTLEKLGIAAHAVDAHLVAGRVCQALGRSGDIHLAKSKQLSTGAPVLIRLKGQIAAALREDSSDQAILTSCRTGLIDLAQHRASLASMELRVRASAHGAELGRIGLRVLLRSGAPGQVFSWLERTRAAALIAVEPTTDLGVEELLGALRTVQADLAAARSDRTSLDAEPPELLSRQAVLEGQIRRATWRRSSHPGSSHPGNSHPGNSQHSNSQHSNSQPSNSQPSNSQPNRSSLSPPSTSELRRHLDGQILIEYGTNDGMAFAAVVEPRRTRIVPLGSMADVSKQRAQLLFALQMLLQPNLSTPRAAAARLRAEVSITGLRKLLLDPIALPADVPVVVVPTGSMQRIPWSALWDGHITVAPSAGLWQATRTRETGCADQVLLVAGPDLPGATAEINTLAELHPNATILTPPHSTAEAVLKALPQSGLAHLACHLNLRSDNPSFSALQLADGFLTMHELEVRGIAPHRMILAACNSATDVSYEGNEVLGFVSALISHGTNGVVASIVVVPDAAAVPLMKSLHEGVISGQTLSAALYSARRNTDREDPTEFVNWCAFNSYGAA